MLFVRVTDASRMPRGLPCHLNSPDRLPQDQHLGICERAVLLHVAVEARWHAVVDGVRAARVLAIQTMARLVQRKAAVVARLRNNLDVLLDRQFQVSLNLTSCLFEERIALGWPPIVPVVDRAIF